MKEDDKIIESLIAGGIIGAALGALLSKKSGEGGMLGAIAGAAILATYKANEKARNANVPLLVEEDGCLYEIRTDGSKHFISKIEKPSEQLPEHYKLK